jgi:hypothetical protein
VSPPIHPLSPPCPETCFQPYHTMTTLLMIRVDLRSIMAETAAAKTPTRPSATTTSTPSSLLSRPKASPGGASTMASPVYKPPIASRSPSSVGPSTAAGVGSWKTVEIQRPSLSAVQASQAGSSSGMMTRPGPSVASSSVSASQRTASAKAMPMTRGTQVPSNVAGSSPSIIRKPSR